MNRRTITNIVNSASVSVSKRTSAAIVCIFSLHHIALHNNVMRKFCRRIRACKRLWILFYHCRRKRWFTQTKLVSPANLGAGLDGTPAGLRNQFFT